MKKIFSKIKEKHNLKKQREAEMSPVQKKARDNLFVVFSGLLIVIMLIMFSVLSFQGRDREYSENENRYLEAKPKFTASTVFEGKYMENMEAYLSDHFFARDSMVKARTRLDIFFGKEEINNIYVGKKHFLFEKPTEYDDEWAEKTLKTINDASTQSAIPAYFALVPNACEVLSDLMPANAPEKSQEKQIKKVYENLPAVHGIDLTPPLKKAKNRELLYYKTDHHWTTKAAQIAFKQIAADMSLDAASVKYKSLCVSNSFQGTMASSTGLFIAKDSIYITVPENDVDYVVTYVEENKKSATLFDSEKLKQKSQYEVFFGGNFAQVNIETSSPSDRVLLLIKDSYANCMVPMLTPFYKKIIMIDPRYYTDNLQQTIEKEKPTEILWLYNVNTFLNDTSIVNSLGND